MWMEAMKPEPIMADRTSLSGRSPIAGTPYSPEGIMYGSAINIAHHGKAWRRYEAFVGGSQSWAAGAGSGRSRRDRCPHYGHNSVV